MNPYQETFNTWNKIAKLYEEKFMHLDLYNQTYDAFCDAIPEHANVLEIGCGPGNITKYILNRRPDLRLEGTDISENMIGLASKNNPTAEFYVMDCRDLDKNQSQYSAILCGFCIPYLLENDCRKFIKNCSEKILPGGLLYLSFVEGDPEQSGFISGSSGDRTYFSYYKADEIEKTLSQNSFHLVKTVDLPYQKNNGEKEIHKILLSEKIQSKSF
ncbi:MAG: class I SAM-dependent methyltransferase [Bacteroidia bacterium]|nr:class I SAM-dependent methyltransferase [Bacteroidia bacterium]